MSQIFFDILKICAALIFLEVFIGIAKIFFDSPKWKKAFYCSNFLACIFIICYFLYQS